MIDINQIKEILKDKKLLGITILVLLILIFLCSNIFKTGTKYETQQIEKRTITQVVEASGTINPVNTLLLP